MDDINISRREPLKVVKGLWEGYFLRTSIDGPEEGGGMVKVLMEVEESGQASIFYKESDDENETSTVIYTGFFFFPIDRQASIIVGQFEKIKSVYRLTVHLRLDSQKLKGIFSGWRMLDSVYFTSPIYFKRIFDQKKDSESHESFIDSLLKKIKPARYHYTSAIVQDSRDIINQFKRIQTHNFATIENCLYRTQNQIIVQSIEFKLFRPIQKSSTLKYSLIAKSKDDTRVFFIRTGHIAFDEPHEDEVQIIDRDYTFSNLYFRFEVSFLNQEVFRLLNFPDFSLTVHKDKDQTINLYPGRISETEGIMIDKNSSKEEYKELHTYLRVKFLPLFEFL